MPTRWFIYMITTYYIIWPDQWRAQHFHIEGGGNLNITSNKHKIFKHTRIFW